MMDENTEESALRLFAHITKIEKSITVKEFKKVRDIRSAVNSLEFLIMRGTF